VRLEIDGESFIVSFVRDINARRGSSAASVSARTWCHAVHDIRTPLMTVLNALQLLRRSETPRTRRAPNTSGGYA
jgi:signal transduction histidine kinase